MSAGQEPTKPADTSGQLTLEAVITLIRKQWILVAVCLAACLGLSIAASVSMTKVYEASMTLYFDPRPPKPLGGDVDPVIDTSADYWNRKEYYNTQHWILTSRSTLEPVVVQLRLHWDRGFLKNGPSRDPASVALAKPEEAALILASRMKVTPIADSRLAKITLRDANAERGAQILAAIAKTYIEQNERELMSATEEASSWLHGQVSVLKEDLEKSEVDLHHYKKEKNLLSLSLDEQSNMRRGEIEQLNESLTAAKARRQQVAGRNAALASVPTDNPSELPARELLDSEVLKALRSEFLESSRQRESLMAAGKGEAHPAVVTAAAKRETTRLALLGEIKNIRGALARELAAIDVEIGGLQALYNKAHEDALNVNKLEIEYKRLRRTRDTNERLFSLVTERSKESDLARLLRVNTVRVVESAIIPKRPVIPNVPLNILGGIVAGLILGIGIAVARETLDRTIRGPEDAEASAGLPILGMLPASGTTSRSAYGKRRQAPKQVESLDLLAHLDPTGTFSEAARALRTSIFFSSPDKPAKTLLVTSAVAGDGKTTVASNLAITIAQTGQRVVLIDCDLRRSRLHRAFELANQPGLTGTLAAGRPAIDAVSPTKIQNLSVVTSGPLPPNPSELLHSELFQTFIASLEKDFDLIVVDSPPLVPVTDAAIIANRMDAVILVTRTFKTSRNSVRQAARILQSVGANAIGVVVNDFVAGPGPQSYYYREYGYTPRPEDAPSYS